MNTITKETLQDVLSAPYADSAVFEKKVLLPIFCATHADRWKKMQTGNLLTVPGNPLACMANAVGLSSIHQLGEFRFPFARLKIYDIEVTEQINLLRNRVGIQKLIRTHFLHETQGAFLIFHYAKGIGNPEWRFSFCYKGDGAETDAKRYTFLFGPQESCRTAQANFLKLAEDAAKDSFCMKNVQDAFSVQKLAEDFYTKYEGQYKKFCDYLAAHHEDDSCFGPMFKTLEPKHQRDYVKHMLGRIVFLHFLQKKGWLGAAPDAQDWTTGDRDFLYHLYERCTTEQQDDFLDGVLEPLFADALNTKRNDDTFDTGVEGIGRVRVPYLNGGLFELSQIDEERARFPRAYFRDLLDFLHQYNFTIDEADPYEAKVGVDPEMLSRIFENLLEDNHDKGAYYTPKKIVDLMCRQSLLSYLSQGIKAAKRLEALRSLVMEQETEALLQIPELKDQVVSKLKRVRICDPAIGSGAFPMGLLQELALCRSLLEPTQNLCALKKEILQNNIFGVDIERGAVDIARLRFWLALVVEEETPHALPNMDFKIMQGNSLLETFCGIDLGTVGGSKKDKKDRQGNFLFDEEGILKEISRLMHDYYDKSRHDEKVANRQKIESLVKDYMCMRAEGNASVQEQIKNLTFPNADFFLWHTWFREVFDEGGFDIVIGNPPYISFQRKGCTLGELYKNAKFKTFTKAGDIYCLFYEQGLNILRKGGLLCYITSNKWMKAKYGKALRKLMCEETSPLMLLDFPGVRLFSAATVDTNILLTIKSQTRNLMAYRFNQQQYESTADLNGFVRKDAYSCPIPENDAPSWSVPDVASGELWGNLRTRCRTLKSRGIGLYYGVKTGNDEAFHISSAHRDVILRTCRDDKERKKTEEIIRPLLESSDIVRYGATPGDMYLVALLPSRQYDIEKLPALKKHLLSFERSRLQQAGRTDLITDEHLRSFCYQRLQQNGSQAVLIDGQHIELPNKSNKMVVQKSRKKTRLKWFEVQDTVAYADVFNKERIVYGQFQQGCRFGWAEPGIFIGGNHYMIECTENYPQKCLLGILNSTMSQWILGMLSSSLGSSAVIAQKSSMLQFPLPDLGEEIQKELTHLVECRLKETSAAKQKKLEEQIDVCVFRAYGITKQEEIDIITKSGNDNA